MNFDVIIVGAGLVGRYFAVGLALKGLKVASIEHESIDTLQQIGLDGRTTAIALGARYLFEKLNLWQEVEPFAAPIHHIRVVEGGSPWVLDYDSFDVGPEPMGYIVENPYLRKALYSVTPENLTLFSPVNVLNVEYLKNLVKVTLSSGEVLIAPLLVAADGRYSKLRSNANINVSSWDYGQRACIAHIYHEKPHQDTAFEIFYPEGPLAVLPMVNDPLTHRPRSGLVWCKSKTHPWENQSDADLATELYEKFPYYGKIEFYPKRWYYPLSALKVNTLIDERFAMIGDAGHVVHPISGQGVNVGWRDADCLISLLSEAKNLGLDLGDASLLKRYDQKRKLDRLSILWVTDAVTRLYSYQATPLKFLRNAAFAALNPLKPLKRIFMKKAMGI